MLKSNMIDKYFKRYVCQSLIIITIISVVLWCISYYTTIGEINNPLIVGIVFSFVIELCDGFIWRLVAKNNQDFLPTFYTAVSGFRMLLALATLFVVYLIVGKQMMLPYCIVFMIYYFVLLIHHSIFFSKVSNSLFKCYNDK